VLWAIPGTATAINSSGSRHCGSQSATTDTLGGDTLIMWPFSRRAAVATGAVDILNDTGLTEQYMKVRSLARRELHWALRSRQALITGLGISLLVNGAQGWTLAAVMPTVRLVPVMVNARADGTVAAEPIMSMMPTDVQSAVIRATLWTYVEQREGYSPDTAAMRSRIVRELSDREVGQAYADWYNYPNPDSPQVKFGKKGIVTIEQDTADFLSSDPSVYQVNYWRTVAVPGESARRTHWTAFVHFELVEAIPLNERVSINPGAVKVIAYPPPTEIDAPKGARQ
jgi:type IV secretion system protein VirB8